MKNRKNNIRLSTLVVAHNEEQRLHACLSKLEPADEIVVILDKTTDNSKKIAEKYTKKIYEGSWDFEGERRNFGLNKCEGDWILEVDADEIIYGDSIEYIVQQVKMYHTVQLKLRQFFYKKTYLWRRVRFIYRRISP